MSVLGGNVIDSAELAKSGVGDAAIQGTSKEIRAGRGSMDVGVTRAASSDNSMLKTGEVYEDTPTEEELQTLRRVSGKIPWTAWTIAFVELCER